jgi:hypothetical protein
MAYNDFYAAVMDLVGIAGVKWRSLFTISAMNAATRAD